MRIEDFLHEDTIPYCPFEPERIEELIGLAMRKPRECSSLCPGFAYDVDAGEIVACDDCGRFPDDQDAADYVALLAFLKHTDWLRTQVRRPRGLR